MNESAIKLMETIDSAYSMLCEIDEKKSWQKAGPETWSDREIIGHLIDSAYNNRVRFINAQFKDDLIFEGYDQDGWVQFMKYQDIEFANLIERLKQLNTEIVSLIGRMPESKLLQKTKNHNLDKVAFRKFPKDRPVHLQYFIIDYINHMRHHLNAILSGKLEMLPNP